MTRKDYNAIAAILRDEPTEDDHEAREAKSYKSSLVEAIADHCEQDNPRFQRARFLLAAGVEVA